MTTTIEVISSQYYSRGGGGGADRAGVVTSPARPRRPSHPVIRPGSNLKIVQSAPRLVARRYSLGYHSSFSR
ncbi:hypothetical protein EVAR_26013_1 [Eumeta japonica]|uniref:Uncharacterized protein n=1 Tax=Eumeta variegata TaxID=151549 RepID=A0A4C1VQJ7_EUMVA|nr:hypothetical protein EVAR_26013_1 [Eumeta japonica]